MESYKRENRIRESLDINRSYTKGYKKEVGLQT